MQKNDRDHYQPHEAIVVERIDESPSIFTLRLKFTDPEVHKQYRFSPGQFNMLYLYGVGEVAISVVSDPSDSQLYDHTIRIVGRVTRGLAKLQNGDRIGVRGPYGRGWPTDKIYGKDVLVVTGGLGCAPVVAMINYIFRRREDFGKLSIVQGVKHSDEFIYQGRYEQWGKEPNTEIFITADEPSGHWPWYKGTAVDVLPKIKFKPENTVALMCGPEIMMKFTVKALLERGLAEKDVYLSMERNMQCAVGHCGHCQYGGLFICKDGPVFTYPELKALFTREGF
jgi:NAD(P)H-flavin reductase